MSSTKKPQVGTAGVPNTLEHFTTEIRKTGYVLENNIVRILRQGGWSVIGSKYYIDDVTDDVREMDILAYKAKHLPSIQVYTVLIISCKKSDNNAWVFLTRKANTSSPNHNWWPLSVWTNIKAVQHHLEIGSQKEEYRAFLSANGVVEALSEPEMEVFAFQEMDKDRGTPHNDKAIFSSITSLMKAQAYELSVLPSRKPVPAVYQFNLLAVVDAPLVRLVFDDNGKIEASSISSEHYIARYIVNREDIFSRIRFLKADIFEHALKDYDRLFSANLSWFDTQVSAFYSNILSHPDRVNLLFDDFYAQVYSDVSVRVKTLFGETAGLTRLRLHWDEENGRATIKVEGENLNIDGMNADHVCAECAKHGLSNVYKYTGEFVFECLTWLDLLDLPDQL